MKVLMRVLIVALAVLGMVVLLTDWIDWPWWVGLVLCTPLGLLLLATVDFGDSYGEGGTGGGWLGGDGGGGDGGGGGGGNGG